MSSKFHSMKELRQAGTSIRITSNSTSILRDRPSCCWPETKPAAGKAGTEMHDAVQAQRLADIRKAHGHARQADVAALMGVSQARVSKLESGDLSRTEVGTLQAYVAALGGQLRIIAEFGEKTVELTE